MRKKILLLTSLLILTLSGCGNKDADKNAASDAEPITCKIICKLDNNYSLGVDDEELIITEDGNDEDISFTLHPVDDKYYYIEHDESGLVLGTEDQSNELHAKVTLLEYEEHDTQLWRIGKSDDDYYFIINKENDLFLDINDAKIFEGNILQLYTRNDSYKAQSWKFIDLEDGDIEYEPNAKKLKSENLENASVIEEIVFIANKVDDFKVGTSYRIICKYDATYSIGAELGDINKVILTNSENSDSFSYYIEAATDDSFYIVHEESGLVMELQDGATENHTHVCLGEKNGDISQQWYIVPAPEEGYYYFTSVASGHNLDVTHMGVFDGNWLQIYQSGISDAQSWMFTNY